MKTLDATMIELRAKEKDRRLNQFKEQNNITLPMFFNESDVLNSGKIVDIIFVKNKMVLIFQLRSNSDIVYHERKYRAYEDTCKFNIIVANLVK